MELGREGGRKDLGKRLKNLDRKKKHDARCEGIRKGHREGIKKQKSATYSLMSCSSVAATVENGNYIHYNFSVDDVSCILFNLHTFMAASRSSPRIVCELESRVLNRKTI